MPTQLNTPAIESRREGPAIARNPVEVEPADLFPAPVPVESLATLATQINQAHADAQEHKAKAVERALTAGDLLNSVKAQLKHGEFLPWCKQHCPAISQRTIQDYTRVARELPIEMRSAAHLSLREALRLVAGDSEDEPEPEAAPMLTDIGHDSDLKTELLTAISSGDEEKNELINAISSIGRDGEGLGLPPFKMEEVDRRAVLDSAAAAGDFTAVRANTGNVHVPQGNNDWYTPAEFIEAARGVMGGIDLDPASSDIAQETVKAGAYFTAETNSLDKPWHGRVWMNPPFSMPLIQQFIDKLLAEWAAGRVSQAVVLTNNATETDWFQALLEVTSGVCFPSSRIKFYSPVRTSSSPRQGQALFYLPDISWRKKRNQPDPVDVFKRRFSEFGPIMEVSV